jgi:hypothetical protein
MMSLHEKSKQLLVQANDVTRLMPIKEGTITKNGKGNQLNM